MSTKNVVKKASPVSAPKAKDDPHSTERARLKRKVTATEKEFLRAGETMKSLSKLIRPNLDGMDKFVESVRTWRNMQRENKAAIQQLAAFDKKHPLKGTKPSPRKA